MILMTYCLLLYNIPEFRMVKTFAEPPAQDVVLRMPLDVVLDDEGYLYCLDGLEKKVIVWGEGGDYIRALGGEGDGPGELRLKYPGQASIAYDGEMVVVWDDPAHRLTFFTSEGFSHTQQKPEGMKRVAYFKILRNGNGLFWLQNNPDEGSWSELVLTDRDFNITRVVMTVHDNMFIRNRKEGWDYRPFSPIPIIWADYHANYFLAGDSQDDVGVYDLTGNLIRRISVRGVAPELTSNDKKNVFQVQTWIKPPHQVNFPKTKRRYERVLPLKQGLIYVGQYEPVDGSFDGRYYSHRSSIPIDFSLGDYGDIYFTGKRLLGCVQNEEGDLFLQEWFFDRPRH